MINKLIFCTLLSVSLSVTAVMAQSPATAKPKVYGAAMLQSEPFYATGRLPSLMQGQQSRELQLVGVAKDVCQKEGCWMTIALNRKADGEVMVKIKDHAFALPKDIAGKQVMVRGTVVKKTQTVAEQKHYLEDAGAAKEEIAKIKAPKEIYEVQAVSVAVN